MRYAIVIGAASCFETHFFEALLSMRPEEA